MYTDLLDTLVSSSYTKSNIEFFQGAVLPTWFNVSPRMDRYLHQL